MDGANCTFLEAELRASNTPKVLPRGQRFAADNLLLSKNAFGSQVQREFRGPSTTNGAVGDRQ
jgi:hypothetical protein